MNRLDFAQAVIRVRVLEKRLLTREKLLQLAETKSTAELWKLLETTSYGELLEKIETLHQFEIILDEALKQVYQTIQEISPLPEIRHLLTLKYDYHNMKVFCKETLLETDFSHLYLPYGSLEITALDDFDRYRQKVAQVMLDYKKYKDPQRIDIILDQYYMEDLYNRLSTLNVPVFMDYLKEKIDFLNVRTLIRLKRKKRDLSSLEQAVLPYGNIHRDTILFAYDDSVSTLMRTFRKEKISEPLLKGLEAYQESKRLTEFETVMENHLMEIVRKAKTIHFGPEPLLAYGLAKEMEINNLRMIILSKLRGIEPESIKQRMREGYV